MFNNYKKNKSKNLPKFNRGGSTRAGADTSRTMYGSEAGAYGNTSVAGQGGDATSNLYNEKRNSNLSSDQWSAVAKGAASTGAAFSANQSLTGQDKTQADYNAINSGVNSVAGAVTPWYTYAKAGSDMGRGMIARDENGVPVDKTNAQMDAVMKPHHEMITEDLSKGNTGLAVAELLLPGIGYESRSNAMGLGSTINKTLGVKNTDYMYAMGGVNIQPNAEVEKQENTLNPDGTTTQFNGPSHEQGGIPTQLDPGTLIFSDKLKHGGKTFAQLNKANLTHKEDKILNDPNSSNTLKQTAQLMKDTKYKNSISLFKIQEEMKQSKLDNYKKRLGGIQKYPLGGAVDNTKFTPTQKEQAYTDSMTLYKSGFNKNIPNWQAEPGFNEAVGRLHTLNGVVPQSTDKSSTAYANDPNYLAKRSVPYAKPTKPVYEVKTEGKNAFPPTYPNYNMLMKGLERPDNFNPELKQVPANSPNTVKTNVVTGPNYSYKEYKQGNEVMDRMYFNPETKKEIELTEFKYGGQLPKYDEGGENWVNRNSDSLYQLGFGLAQNAGQLSYLANEGKNYDKQQFYNYTPNTLNPTMDLHDAQMQNNRAEYNVRGASGGNAGTYLSNRVALNAQNTMNKSRIHQAYENANAGIKNQAEQYNIANRYSVDDINARNKGAALTNYYKTIGSMGTNVAQGMKDNRQMGMDEESIQLMSEFYNSPEAQKMFAKYKKDKSTKTKKD